MARFYGELWKASQEHRTVSRTGSANSPLNAHIRGWHSGVQIYCYAAGDEDILELYLTTGSNGNVREKFIGRVVVQNEKPVLVLAQDQGSIECEQ